MELASARRLSKRGSFRRWFGAVEKVDDLLKEKFVDRRAALKRGDPLHPTHLIGRQGNGNDLCRTVGIHLQAYGTGWPFNWAAVCSQKRRAPTHVHRQHITTKPPPPFELLQPNQ
jgi:hypothetical protein